VASVKRFHRLVVPVLAGLATVLALVPAAASARPHERFWSSPRTFGATSLVLDQGAADALNSLGVTPGLVGPAFASGGAFNFPITNSVVSALRKGSIAHAGGISLTKDATTVKLTDFWINLKSRDLSAVVNGGARLAILSLDLSQAKVGLSHGVLTLGPVTASLTKTAADALNQAFGVQAFTEGLTLGQATVRYRLFW
jgi:hypothetical protein